MLIQKKPIIQCSAHGYPSLNVRYCYLSMSVHVFLQHNFIVCVLECRYAFLLFLWFCGCASLLCVFVCLFCLCHTACGILVLRPGIEPSPPALGAWSLNHWTAREVLILYFYIPPSWGCTVHLSREH